MADYAFVRIVVGAGLSGLTEAGRGGHEGVETGIRRPSCGLISSLPAGPSER